MSNLDFEITSWLKTNFSIYFEKRTAKTKMNLLIVCSKKVCLTRKVSASIENECWLHISQLSSSDGS